MKAATAFNSFSKTNLQSFFAREASQKVLYFWREDHSYELEDFDGVKGFAGKCLWKIRYLLFPVIPPEAT
ncbi:hypothetical protein SADUNF_Sadunf02G0131900 [Salix dunnii]|uniref:Uncharacterized protein n=1 Tax=Salix dunnii TaxID=1413687 RepID=A0A835TH79_9ROSI|nr:hypothetical protein SADUNF_Sadunf02G0131900 [Salix dunnii]